jgi:hypothetical protein
LRLFLGLFESAILEKIKLLTLQMILRLFLGLFESAILEKIKLLTLQILLSILIPTHRFGNSNST